MATSNPSLPAEPFRGRRVLVTGGAGFIGSHLVEALLELNTAHIRVLDNFATGRRENIRPFLPHIELMEEDLRHPDAVRQACAGIDYVFHQGAIPSVPRSIHDPIESAAVNVMGTTHVLTAAREQGVRRVVFASSSSVYGNSEVLPKVETMPLQALSPYAASKAAGELMCRSFLESSGVESVALRYFNVFGPRQDPTSQYAAAVAKFAQQVRKGAPVTVFGDGLQTRDFTYVANVVQANLKAAVAPGAAGGVFNVGCGGQITILELATALGELLGKEVHIEHLPERRGDVRHSLADISAARRVLGYEPGIDLVEGLRRTLAWDE